ncbi:AcetylCholine Receptor [Caenorhabditis elegans]|uniref:AcetylCholine Receptor n=2 Tax=Caenorhabditis elegans TaxID=6239 RepID=A0A3P6NP92_CAEEL|nr:AcetylCholine Receptor [Caenorhabditis elegans]VDJ63121.1 AcetylCholine Receptor [Caenorhabditis elegans]|eukprot:NP_001355513.1 AcetylCholine Receptor [Caenorhabditis elegans]
MLTAIYNISLFLFFNGAHGGNELSSRADQNVMRLYRDLLYDYNNEVRPSVHSKEPINVTFVFSLTQIIDVDERNQILTTNSWIRLHWVDYKLVWDPRLYQNVTRIHIPSDKIWKPDIILYNNADAQYMKSVMSTDVIVDYLGNIHWPLSAIFTSSCPLDVKHYPFDRQTCILKYASWAYDGTKIDLLLKSEQGDLTNYITNTEWSLIGIRAEKNQVIYSCCPEPYPFIDVHVTIERRAMFYVFNLILPCVLISLIALMGFYMPTDSGEKVTLGITSLLSTTVFLMMVAEGMPPTAEALPLIGIYFGVTIMLVALGTAMTVFTVNIHHTGVHGYPVPPFLQIFAFRYLSKILFVRIEPYHSIAHHVRYMYQKEHPTECTLSASVHYKRLHDFDANVAKKEEQYGLQRDMSNLSVISANVHCNPDDRLLLGSQSSQKNLNKFDSEKNLRSSLSIRSGSPTAKKKVSFSSLNSHGTPIDSPIYGRKLGRTQSQTPTSSYRNSNGNGGITSDPLPQQLSNPPKISLTDVDDVFENNENQQPMVDEFEKEFLRVMSMVHGIIERNEMRVAEKDKRDAIALEWQQVAMVLDRFLLVVFLIGTSMSTFVILNQRNLFEST